MFIGLVMSSVDFENYCFVCLLCYTCLSVVLHLFDARDVNGGGDLVGNTFSILALNL